MLADEIEAGAKAGIVNIVGGCCGTSPEHIAAIARRVAPSPARAMPKSNRKLRLSGWKPFNVTPIAVRQRRRAHQRHRLARLRPMILEGRFDDRAGRRPPAGGNGAQVIDINMDEAMLDSIAAMDVSST